MLLVPVYFIKQIWEDEHHSHFHPHPVEDLKEVETHSLVKIVLLDHLSLSFTFVSLVPMSLSNIVRYILFHVVIPTTLYNTVSAQLLEVTFNQLPSTPPISTLNEKSIFLISFHLYIFPDNTHHTTIVIPEEISSATRHYKTLQIEICETTCLPFSPLFTGRSLSAEHQTFVNCLK
ncbi:hypothetical protein BLNAU_19296 [Blattamonas nauphoetae]|uniref:Uncharacterized protein n=1 Tax=Blattamonas nauphoetae TaxID=2049346 RepID=A0ABQ9X2K4_9EUKA|nr:hypothetical protein BLNAU_19296 [Blattamonas nauphoetae]